MRKLSKGDVVTSEGGLKRTVLTIVDDVVFLSHPTVFNGSWPHMNLPIFNTEQWLRDKGYTWQGMDDKEVWVPKVDRRYYTPSITGGDSYEVYSWDNDEVDKTNMERGLVFRTKEEAIARANEILALIEGK